MRREPALVDRIAGEAAAEMVVDAAERHPLERDEDAVPRLGVARAAGVAGEELDHHRIREFRRAGEAAMRRVEGADEALADGVEIGKAKVAARRPAPPGLAEALDQEAPVVGDPLRLAVEDARHLAQHVDEARPAEFRLLREVGAAPERLAAGGQEHGQRPAALLAEEMQRAHVDVVDVGALLAVDLDVHEELVHDRRDALVLEALMGHDVAPMAGGVADREQHRPARRRRLGEGLRPPFAPIDRVVLVLQEIGRGGLGEAVHRGSSGVLIGPSSLPLILRCPRSGPRRTQPCRRSAPIAVACFEARSFAPRTSA